IILVRDRSRAFLAGPPLLKAATGEVATEEELGGAVMHTSVSGLGDYLAEDDRDALRLAREILAKIAWDRAAASAAPAAPAGALPSGQPAVLHPVAQALAARPPVFKPPRLDAGELLGLMPLDGRRPVDMREVIARIADDSDFLAFGENYGSATLCGHFQLEGWPVGVITNNGPIDSAGAAKATHFIQACCQSRTPLLYLQNTTGFMVGRAHEEAGIIKHGSKMIQAVTNATVPQITLHCGASFGAGNYGMCGRGFQPRFCFSWPNARTAVMGGEQAAQTMRTVTEAAMRRKNQGQGEVDTAQLDALEQRIVQRFDSQMSVLRTSALLLDDGVIDPRDTRAVLA
ncbi:MAG: acyl-CoA carboxylase subunit beta, partial [Rubrivivax sp.]